VAGAGLAGAVVLDPAAIGVGWLLAGAVMVAATAFARWRQPCLPDDAPPEGLDGRPARWGWSAAALALLAVGTVRAAPWLFGCCVLSACVAGSVAMAGGRSGAELARRAFALPVEAVRSAPWLGRGVARLGSGGDRAAVRLLVALGVGAGLLGVFGVLLAGADAAFARLLGGLLDSGLIGRALCCFMLVGLGTAGVVYRLGRRHPALPASAASPAASAASEEATAGSPAPVPASAAGPAPPGLRRLEWAVPVVLLDALFAAFVGVQATAFLRGRAYIENTVGVTYAEYARRGFWQLVAVTLLTLGVIALAVRVAPRRTRPDRMLLRLLLGVLAVLTLVIVATALRRLALYEQAYGWTRLRLLVGACEVWFGVIFVLILAAGVRRRARWVPRAVLGTGLAALLLLSAANPDRFIADRNVDRYFAIDRIDAAYLAGLSPDAAPALLRLPEPVRSCALARIRAGLAGTPPGWRAWNLGREAARRVVRTVTPDPVHCAEVVSW
jgi:hypothetical protein